MEAEPETQRGVVGEGLGREAGDSDDVVFAVVVVVVVVIVAVVGLRGGGRGFFTDFGLEEGTFGVRALPRLARVDVGCRGASMEELLLMLRVRILTQGGEEEE